MKTVSIILPVYQGEQFLGETLNSIFSQSFKDFEVLILNDGSSDGSGALISKWRGQDQRLRVLENSLNRGVGYSYKRLLSSCEGVYIAQIGQDDLWEPSFLEKMIAALEASPASPGVFSEVKIMDEYGQALVRPDIFDISSYKARSQVEQALALFQKNSLCASGSLFRRECINSWVTLGDIDQLQDWATWLQLTLFGRLIILPQTLVSYRLHQQNLSGALSRRAQLKNELSLCRYHFLSSTQFSSLISKDPDVLAKFVSIYRSEDDSEAAKGRLEIALRLNSGQFEGLWSYHLALSHLFWEGGSVDHGLRHLKVAMSLNLDSLPGYSGHRRTWILELSLKASKQSVNEYPYFSCRSWKVGPFRLIRAATKNKKIPRISLRFTKRQLPLSRAIENCWASKIWR